MRQSCAEGQCAAKAFSGADGTAQRGSALRLRASRDPLPDAKPGRGSGRTRIGIALRHAMNAILLYPCRKFAMFDLGQHYCPNLVILGVCERMREGQPPAGEGAPERR